MYSPSAEVRGHGPGQETLQVGKHEVAISFVGDGASNQGTFLESLNLAAVWNLPAIFVVENNGYAESTSRDYAVAVDSYVDRNLAEIARDQDLARYIL